MTHFKVPSSFIPALIWWATWHRYSHCLKQCSSEMNVLRGTPKGRAAAGAGPQVCFPWCSSCFSTLFWLILFYQRNGLMMDLAFCWVRIQLKVEGMWRCPHSVLLMSRPYDFELHMHTMHSDWKPILYIGNPTSQFKTIFGPGWCGSVDWAPTCEPKGR